MWGAGPGTKRARFGGERQGAAERQRPLAHWKLLRCHNFPYPPARVRGLALGTFSGVDHMRWSALAAAVLMFAATQAKAELLVRVDKNTQQMTVARDGHVMYRWPVSTGIAKYDTPDGDFRPFRMEKEHFSKEWDDA